MDSLDRSAPCASDYTPERQLGWKPLFVAGMVRGLVYDISHLTLALLHQRAIFVPYIRLFGQRGRRLAHSSAHWSERPSCGPRKAGWRPGRTIIPGSWVSVDSRSPQLETLRRESPASGNWPPGVADRRRVRQSGYSEQLGNSAGCLPLSTTVPCALVFATPPRSAS